MYAVYDRTFGDFLAKNTVSTPYIIVLANPKNTVMYRSDPSCLIGGYVKKMGASSSVAGETRCVTEAGQA
jgi:hypothetical protein